MLRLLDPERIETLKAQVVVPNALGPVIAPSLAGDDARAAVLSAPRLTARTHLSGWKDWSVLSGHGATAASERPVAHLHFVLDAALAGWGAAVLPWALAAEAVADGRLLAPFGFHADGGAVAAIPGAGEPSRARRAFVRWLIEQGQAMPPAPRAN